MLLITYDISDTKLRTVFSKFIKKFGRRLQFSVYEVKNSPRLKNIILVEIEKKFAPLFKKTDSILVFDISASSYDKIIRYGYAANEEEEVLFFD